MSQTFIHEIDVEQDDREALEDEMAAMQFAAMIEMDEEDVA